MPVILPVQGIDPKIPSSCYVAPNATIVGDVEFGEQCSIWFNAVVRGDVNAIRIGDRTNIQDGAIIHCTFHKTQTHIGNDVSIGHNAIVHGCRVDDGVLIGMGAIVMDNAHIKKGAVIAAGSVVLENTIVEEGELFAGVPAKRVKNVSEEMKQNLLKTAKNYILYSDWFKNA